MANVSESNTMNFHPGEICTVISEEYFSRKSKGCRVTYQECLQRNISCQYCGVELMDGSITAYHR